MLEIALRHALPAFTLDIALNLDAELVVLFGRSGAGKTLTLRAVAGLFRPAQGRIALNGRVLFDDRAQISLRPQARRVGYVPQSYALFPHLTAAENVEYALHGAAAAERPARVREMLALVGLEALAGRRPAQLSGGQQQRVALARALVRRPDVLLLDEPLSALDALTRSELRGSLRELQRHFRIPVLFVTHDLAEAYVMGDRLAVFGEGRILQVDAPAAVLQRPASRAVARLVGGRNIFDGRVAAATADGLRVRVGEVDLLAAEAPGAASGPVTVCIRPERIIFVRPERMHAERENLLPGRIVGERTDGTMMWLSFRLDGPRLCPGGEHDLEIELPVYIHERLGLSGERDWHVSIKREALHLITDGA